MNNKEIMTVYLKAYTSKKAADSVADDMAVGTGIGLLGGLAGYGGGYIRGEKLRQAKAPKIERVLNRIRDRINELKLDTKDVRTDLLFHTKRLGEVNNAGKDTSRYESIVRKDRDKLNKLEQAAIKQKNRSIKTGSKLGKLQKAIKNSKRLGGAVGAVGAGLLGTLLYNKLQKD